MIKNRNDWGAIVGGSFFALWMIYGAYGAFFKTTNIIGPIGADKTGRQVLIQSLDSSFKRVSNNQAHTFIASEWIDTSFPQRFFIQEPMRTTLIFLPLPDAQPLPVEQIEAFLSSPYMEIIGKLSGPDITIQEGLAISPVKMIEKVVKIGGVSFEDYLACYGFQRFEVRQNGATLFARELKTLEGGAHVVGGD